MRSPKKEKREGENVFLPFFFWALGKSGEKVPEKKGEIAADDDVRTAIIFSLLLWRRK